MARDKVYFISDLHLGVPDAVTSRAREERAVRWLDSIKSDAAALYIVGDLFDFWYEYRTAVPKGFVRIQGKLAEMSDAGVDLHIFTGNHDMWMFRYFEEELGATMHRGNLALTLGPLKILVGHGDGLGPGDHGYKFIKQVFANPVCIWLFGWLHPDIGIGLARFWSGRSREANLAADDEFHGTKGEWLYQYCLEVSAREHYDAFIFGHRHLVLDMPVGSSSRYINLGAWFHDPHCAVLDAAGLRLERVP